MPANFLDAGGMKPIMGRNFSEEENSRQMSLWQYHLQSVAKAFRWRSNIVIKHSLNIYLTEVGVMPGVSLPKGAEIYGH